MLVAGGVLSASLSEGWLALGLDVVEHLLELLHGLVVGGTGMLVSAWGLEGWGSGDDSSVGSLTDGLSVTWGELGDLVSDSTNTGGLGGRLALALGSLLGSTDDLDLG